jgi:hypothetical protein
MDQGHTIEGAPLDPEEGMQGRLLTSTTISGLVLIICKQRPPFICGYPLSTIGVVGDNKLLIQWKSIYMIVRLVLFWIILPFYPQNNEIIAI